MQSRRDKMDLSQEMQSNLAECVTETSSVARCLCLIWGGRTRPLLQWKPDVND